MTTPKKLFIKTYGCQMNVYDSERMAEALGGQGYEQTATPDDADMILLNTCHIREKAAEKVYSELGRLKTYKTANPDVKIGVAGCVAQAEGAEIMRRQPAVDLVVGPQSYHRLPEMEAVTRTGATALDTDFPEEDKFERLKTRPKAARGPTAFLTVQEGCDKFCAFCVVPYTRGAEVSRPAGRILDEARGLVERGVREITLLGQNVNAFHGEGPDGKTWGLAGLIEAVTEVNGLERIRYTTSHPRDMDDELIAIHAHPKVMPFLHLPVQSGSDKILKAMNRKHGADLYREVIEKLRKARPDLAFSSDFIVGFPGESDQDFEDTMQLVRDVGYASCYSFKYSARPGTPAANMQGLIRDEISTERLSRLQGLLNEQQLAFNQQSVGQTMSVLMERKGKRDGQIIGRSPYNQSVLIEGNERLIDSIVDVKVTEGYANSVGGEIVLVDETVSASS